MLLFSLFQELAFIVIRRCCAVVHQMVTTESTLERRQQMVALAAAASAASIAASEATAAAKAASEAATAALQAARAAEATAKKASIAALDAVAAAAAATEVMKPSATNQVVAKACPLDLAAPPDRPLRRESAESVLTNCGDDDGGSDSDRRMGTPMGTDEFASGAQRSASPPANGSNVEAARTVLRQLDPSAMMRIAVQHVSRDIGYGHVCNCNILATTTMPVTSRPLNPAASPEACHSHEQVESCPDKQCATCEKIRLRIKASELASTCGKRPQAPAQEEVPAGEAKRVKTPPGEEVSTEPLPRPEGLSGGEPYPIPAL